MQIVLVVGRASGEGIHGGLTALHLILRNHQCQGHVAIDGLCLGQHVACGLDANLACGRVVSQLQVNRGKRR